MLRIYSLITALVLSCSVNAQVLSGEKAKAINNNLTEVRYDQRTAAPLYIEFSSGSSVVASDGFGGVASILGLKASDTWQMIRNEKDNLGFTHSRYQQYYQNIKVVTGEYILHQKGNRLVSANGVFYSQLTISTIANINAQQALDQAKKDIGASKYLWECSEAEQIALTGKVYYPNGELVILPSINGDKKQKAILCWKLDVYATAPHERYNVYVDANTGNVVFKENRICTITTNGTAVTKYSGTQTIKVDSLSSTSYRLREYSRGSGVETYNMLKGTTYTSAVDFTDADNFWNTTTNQDDAALDAHFGAEKTYDYYFNIHNRNSYDNLGSVLKSYVHYSNAYNNAFWNGSVMTYGDGNGTTFSPLTELDIAAHELSHGVTEFTSNLIYSYESGALNESFSDIFGVSVDFYTNPANANWTIGDKSYTPATPGDGIRYMNNPNLEGDPDTYLGTHWYTGTADNGGVHYNSGVQNFWYYLLSSGGSGTNDKGFVYNVSGVGINDARLVAYRNNCYYLTSGAQYADAAYYAIKSANDIFGNCSFKSQQVKNAWDAVGVVTNSLNSLATTAVVGGSCLGAPLQLSANGGTSFSWTGPNGFSSTLQNPVISNSSNSNNGTYTCVITDANGCSGAASTKVNLNNAPSIIVSGGGLICNGSSVQLSANGSVYGQGQSIGSNSTVTAIPDYPTAGASSSIVIGGSTNASSIISVTIDSLIHTYDEDLKIELISPSGSSIILASSVGTSGDNFIRTKFVPVGTSINNGTAPFTGSFAPSQSFSSLTGSANGTWSLKVTDLGAVDVGTLYKWSIELPANTITSYNWSPSTGLNNAAVANPTASPAQATTYTGVTTDLNGCTAAGTTTVDIGTLTLTENHTDVACSGTSTGSASINVSGNISGTVSYLWTNGETTSSINNLVAGQYSCTFTNGNGCTSSQQVVITQPSTSLSGPLDFINETCGASNGVCSISVSGGVSPYSILWNNGGTGSSITNLPAGTYQATVTDANGCVLTNTITLTNSGIPTIGTIGTITGTKNGVCPGVTKTYSIPVIANATNYNWVVPSNAAVISGQNTNTITVQFSSAFTFGNVSVYGSNICLSTATATAVVRSTPATPGTITGPISNLCGTSSAYSIANVFGATSYTWSVPAGATITSGQGTRIIQVLWPSSLISNQTICVTANNACGSSLAKCLTAVTTLPLKPTKITGPLTVCAGQTNLTYSVTAEPGVTYTWGVPTGGSILTGQGTSTVTVKWGTASGSIRVTAKNTCGSQAIKYQPVSVTCRTSYLISDEITLFPNPNNGNATIELGNEKPFTVLVNDMLGRQIIRKESFGVNYNLNLSDQPKGVYMVSVILENGDKKIFRMVVQ
jgi:Zn-dependent metalloprotease/subtilisin-like proprotein convertase family protein